MAQKKPAAPSSDKKGEYKKLRTAENQGKRRLRHEKRMAQQEVKCPKVKRGTARALRRFTDRTSREFPSVLKGRYTMSMIVRVPKKEHVREPARPLCRINGIEVFSKEHAGYLARELMQAAREREQQTRLAS